jgi:hypothetical protein
VEVFIPQDLIKQLSEEAVILQDRIKQLSEENGHTSRRDSRPADGGLGRWAFSG